MAAFRGDIFENHSLVTELLGDNIELKDQDTGQSLAYLDSLSASGVNQLNQEPGRLKEEHDQLLENTRLLAFRHYRTFIQAAECSREIYKDFNIIEDNLQSLTDSLPEFSKCIQDFSKESQEINSRRKQNSMVLSRLTQLLEILEIPQLMDTCVRNAYYEEALELTNYVKRLEKKFSSIKIIVDIGKEVRKATRLMLQQLLQQLKGNIQLPACLRIIGYLRQLETFSEAELRIKFLQARDSWFQSVLNAIPDKDAYYHITKIIEASRVHLFDIVTQYRAIFSDDDPIFIMEEERAVNYSNILHAWISRKITDFMSTLNKDMNRGVAGRLDSLLSQCMYFGLSFSRVGADFRCLLMPIFNRVVMKTFVQNLETTTKAFEESLMTFSAPKSHVQLDSQRQASKMKTSESSLSPPQELLDFSPLAHYTNGILTCFNELRSFASIPLSKLVRGRLQASLERVSVAIASWTRLETQSQIKKDGSNILVLTRLAIEEFFPYINRCYQAVFKPSAVALVFGRPSLALDQGSSSTEYCTLNIDKILEPLAEYLPEKVAIDQGVEMDFKSNKREDFVKKVERSNRERNDSNSLGTIIKGSVKDKTHQAQGDLDLRDAETTDNEIASLSGAKLDSNSPKDRIDVS
ncbi:conserved oligomeric Golgi complex subunit 8-like [Rhopilema esculentum]|uniref:conserved oligomeric Golgi complex subunit 8-like n=1 Tax=Rhopilema esculentum TaxID=499914 RepID=UPI0031D46ECB